MKLKLAVLLNLLAEIALFMAKIGAGTASLTNHYQPDLPSYFIQED